MMLIEALSSSLQDWVTLPFEALTSPYATLALFGFGMVHVLLPGHGKMLLAARHMAAATGVPAAESRHVMLFSPVLDAFTFAAARAVVALALVVASIHAASALGLAIPVRALRVLAGCALVGIGLHLVFHRLIHKEDKAPESTPLPRRQIDRSLVLLALVPEPVALALVSFGYAQADLTTAALAILSLALGMGTTLALTTLFAGQRAGLASRFASWCGVVIGLVLALAGATVITEAL